MAVCLPSTRVVMTIYHFASRSLLDEFRCNYKLTFFSVLLRLFQVPRSLNSQHCAIHHNISASFYKAFFRTGSFPRATVSCVPPLLSSSFSRSSLSFSLFRLPTEMITRTSCQLCYHFDSKCTLRNSASSISVSDMRCTEIME